MILSAAVLLLASASPAPAGPADVVKEVYTRHFADGQRFDRTLAATRAHFAPTLLALLDADAKAAAAAPGEVVGLDFDPLIFGQDEARSWSAGSATVAGTTARVPVELRTGGEPVRLTVHLASAGGRWRISDLDYGATTLARTLAELAAERKRP